MKRSISAELLVLRKRPSSWILLGVWGTLTLLFAYVVPYVTYLNGSDEELAELLPHALVGNLMGGFPFFGGVLALILGVLALGSEYGWGTLKTLLVQRPGRLRAFGAKLVALALALVPFVLVAFAVGTLATLAIAWREGAAIDWPSAWLVVRGLGAGWVVLAVWAGFGAMLAVVSRGTSLAIGVGLLYAFVIEGLLSALASQVGAVDRVVEFFIRANGYSLMAPLGLPPDEAASNGPGSFSGAFVGGVQALVVLVVYLTAFIAVAASLLRRRDVA
jgi:ABC-2 type transport system permease protein